MGSGSSKEGKPGKTKDQKDSKAVVDVIGAFDKVKPTPAKAAPVDEGISNNLGPGEQQHTTTVAVANTSNIAVPKSEEGKPSPSPSRGSRKKVCPPPSVFNNLACDTPACPSSFGQARTGHSIASHHPREIPDNPRNHAPHPCHIMYSTRFTGKRAVLFPRRARPS